MSTDNAWCNTEVLVFERQPTYAGKWLFGGKHGLSIMQTRRPRWLTRLLCRWLLELEWKDEPKPKE